MVKKLQFVVYTFITFCAIEELTATRQGLSDETQGRITRTKASDFNIDQFGGLGDDLTKEISRRMIMQGGPDALIPLAAVPEVRHMLEQLTPKERRKLMRYSAVYWAGLRQLNPLEVLFIVNKLNQLGEEIFGGRDVGGCDHWTPNGKAVVCCILTDMLLGYLPVGLITTDRALKIVQESGFLKKDASGKKYEIATTEMNKLTPYYRTMLAYSLLRLLKLEGSIDNIELASQLDNPTWHLGTHWQRQIFHEEWSKLSPNEQSDMFCLYAGRNRIDIEKTLIECFSGTAECLVNSDYIKKFCDALLPYKKLQFWGNMICRFSDIARSTPLYKSKYPELEMLLKCTDYWKEEYSGVLKKPNGQMLLICITSSIANQIIRDLDAQGFKKEADEVRISLGIHL